METPLHPVSLRMTFAEKAKLERDAAGMSLSSYIRWRLFDPDNVPPHSRGKHPVGDHKALAQLLAGHHYDLAILDGVMPDMDGFTLARAIREQYSAAALPLMMLTSLDRQSDTDVNLDAAYLRKPVKPSQLQEELQRVLAQQPLARHRSPENRWDVTMGERQPLRILMAEDNRVNQKVILGMLARYGYRADVAANGLEVLESLHRQPYNVVLMDVEMPEMDGEEATHCIRRQLDLARQPYIIAMTANAFEDQRKQYLSTGMNDYISKPVDPAKLVSALERAWQHTRLPHVSIAQLAGG